MIKRLLALAILFSASACAELDELRTRDPNTCPGVVFVNCHEMTEER